MKHFDWMVIDHVDKQGIWFYGTASHERYIFYWNPLRTLKLLFTGKAWFGWFPILKKHIRP